MNYNYFNKFVFALFISQSLINQDIRVGKGNILMH